MSAEKLLSLLQKWGPNTRPLHIARWRLPFWTVRGYFCFSLGTIISLLKGSNKHQTVWSQELNSYKIMGKSLEPSFFSTYLICFWCTHYLFCHEMPAVKPSRKSRSSPFQLSPHLAVQKCVINWTENSLLYNILYTHVC